jgi:hypothetical protein
MDTTIDCLTNLFEILNLHAHRRSHTHSWAPVAKGWFDKTCSSAAVPPLSRTSQICRKILTKPPASIMLSSDH